MIHEWKGPVGSEDTISAPNIVGNRKSFRNHLGNACDLASLACVSVESASMIIVLKIQLCLSLLLSRSFES